MIKPFKISIIGAGSSYTPEIIEGIVKDQASLPVGEICLMDTNSKRLEIMSGFCCRYLSALGSQIQITSTCDRQEAITGARYILTQIRVGGNEQRVLDEKIPMRYGLVGQETTGPGGMFKALRTIPVMLDIARDVEALNPEAWIINYTNPTGLVVEALKRSTGVKIAGLCSGGLFPGWATHEALGAAQASIRYDYVGLNHLNFAYNIRVNGSLISDEEFDRVAQAATNGVVDPELIRSLRLIPSPYLQYFFHTSRKVKEVRAKGRTRGEEVIELEREVYAAYADTNRATKPAALAKRGGGGYSEVALGVMKAITNDQEKVIIVNVSNRGLINFLPSDAVVEIPCLVSGAGITGLQIGTPPEAIWGLIASVKNYEQLAVQAAISGDRKSALHALIAHPLVREYEVAKPLLEEMLQANRQFLPQFYPKR